MVEERDSGGPDVLRPAAETKAAKDAQEAALRAKALEVARDVAVARGLPKEAAYAAQTINFLRELVRSCPKCDRERDDWAVLGAYADVKRAAAGVIDERTTSKERARAMKRNGEEWAKTETRRMGRCAHREALRIMRVYRAIDEESWYAGPATPQATERTSHGPPAPPTSVSATKSVAQTRIVDQAAQRSQTPQDRTLDSESMDHEVLRLRGGRGKHLGSFDLSGFRTTTRPQQLPDQLRKRTLP